VSPHGFEIVQSPFPGWKFKAADTVAVNRLHGLLVVGNPVPVESISDCARRLREFRITLKKGGAAAARDHDQQGKRKRKPNRGCGKVAVLLTRKK
jgi:hypothetical protein